MPAFSATYPPELREAIVSRAMAPAGPGQPPPAVSALVRRAHEGEFGPAGRRLKISTAREWVALARADAETKRLAETSPSAATIADRALALLHLELGRVERAGKRPRGRVDVERVERIVKAAREVERTRAVAGVEPRKDGPAAPSTSAEEPAGSSSPLAAAALERSDAPSSST